ncbi:phosphotransferase [Nocardia sp. NBC_01730]|uniref:hypothetical protein n=1 Tax=Nocardia sp. NBC_01730 TaxID=2975998 RepID=UPI002E0FC1E1|nr:phosphotransferase [Nocardia sp. NBC_01730]
MVDYDNTATRIEWHQVPTPVRVMIENRLGAGVVSAITQSSGFSHGLAARMMLSDGRSAFVKAIAADDVLASAYRAEAACSALLPPSVPAPRLWFEAEEYGWFAVGFDDVEGVAPRFDNPRDMADVLTMIEQLPGLLTPSPMPTAPTFTEQYGPRMHCWQGFADSGPPPDLDEWSRRNLERLAALEDGWHQATVGETLLHSDIRPDNLILRPDRTVVVVDWAWPSRGAAWVDLVAMAPSIAAAGVDPDKVLANHPVTEAVDPAAIDAYLCALVGYWETHSRRPRLERSPRLREHQARSAVSTRVWLRRRLPWG